MRTLGLLLAALLALFLSPDVWAQRGRIIKTGDPVMDPNQDGYVSKTTAGFSTRDYNVPEFEFKMFGIPGAGGDVTEDNIGQSCGITDLIPDSLGSASYAARDAANNLIFRFRVGDDNPSVEAWSILLDTDGLFGADDPNATPNNPGFEVVITLIKNQNKGVYVYNIDGIESCPTPVVNYSFDTHFQISIADEATCGSPDYFYDIYVPLSVLASNFGIDVNTGLKFVAVSGVSATCPMNGQIADVSGVDDNEYNGCHTCAFDAIVAAQCSTPLSNLCETCVGFSVDVVHAPTINQPLISGQNSVSGTTVESDIFIKVQVFTNIAPVGNPPAWGPTPREEHGVYAVGTLWAVTLDNPLLAFDRIVASAQLTENSVPCGAGGGNQTTTSVTVVQPNHPPVANDQSVTLPEDGSTAITLTGSDVDGQPLNYIVVTFPAHGTLTGTAPNLTYTPALFYDGSDSFTFKVNDGIVDSNIGTVSITITPVNHAPVANNQTVTLNEDAFANITLTGSDADGNTLTYSVVSPPTHGSLTGTAPDLVYTPFLNYNGNDSFTFMVNDGTVNSNIATVSIIVTPVNDAPIADNQSVTLPEDGSTPVTLSGSDVEGSALTYTVVAAPTHGTLSGTAPNLTYTAAANYSGPDSFTFKVNDGTVDSNIGTVSITVTPVNDPPIANNQTVTLAEDTPQIIILTGSDIDGNVLTFTIVTPPAHGVISGVAPNITYTPNGNYHGNDSFTFKANDGTVDSNIATVSLTITPVNDPPVANNQSVTLPEDGLATIILTGSDIDGDALTYAIVVSPTHGTLTGTAPNLTYTPALNYNGSDSFTFRVNDGTVNSTTATVTISVTPVNDLPNALNQSTSLAEDGSKAITLTGTDLDGDALTFTVISAPAHGTLTGTAPNLTYTPAANYNGNDSFTFQANDLTSSSNIATVSIIVTPVNDAPVANNQSITLNEDASAAITLTGSDIDGDALTYSIVTGPAHGTLSGTAPNLTYTPAANYNGSDSFTFKNNDGTVDSNIATVSITVSPVNDAPVANNQSVTLNEDASVGITLTGSDIDGDALTYIVVAAPAHGTLSGSAPNLTYTPAANYNGNDSFTFKSNDGTVDSNIATVSITVNPVNDAPVANNQSVTLNEDTSAPIILTGTDIDGDALTYIVVTSPAHGTLSGTAPNLTYVPALFYDGNDSFTFKVNDGTVDSNIATVSITVTHINHAPIANNQNVIYALDTPEPITLSATDVDGDVLNYTVLSLPTNGTLSGTAPNLTYTPNLNYNGPDGFTFRVNDGTVNSNIATVSINFINGPNNAPVADNQTVTVPEDGSTSIILTGSDVDGNALTFTVVGSPGHGTLSGTVPNLTYIPTINYNGPDNFTFRVNDGTVNSPNATVSITVTPVNDAPTANNQSKTVAEDGSTAITLTATDIDGDALTYSIVTPPAHGTFTGVIPNLTYSPAANYNGNDSFVFKANDGSVDSNPATVTITITPVNDVPVANAQGVSVPEDGSVAITLTGSDVDGNPLTFAVVGSPAHGTLSGTAPNLTYIPTLNYNGPDNFTFRVNDGTVNSPNATVSITVTPVNDAPTANNQSVTVAEDGSSAITLTATDVDGDPLTYSMVTPPAHGTLTGTIPNFTYTPAANYNGNDSFVFKANDGSVDSNPGTITITITPVNDVPVANAQAVSVPEDGSVPITLTGSDVEGNTITFTVLGAPAHGTLVGTAPNFTYIPTGNYNGPDNFVFRVNDGTVNSPNATVTITVTPVNDAPIANNQSASLAEDGSKALTLTGTDIDADALTYSIVVPPSHGTLTGTIPNLTYTPAANYNGVDNFTFMVNDGTTNSNTATVSLTVTPVNDPPLANAQTVSVAENASLAIALTGSDIDGGPLSYSVVTSPTHGTLTGTAPNLTYTPTLFYNGPDAFTFRVNDGIVNSANATITITVTPVNQDPIANDQTVSATEDVAKSITLTAGDTDGDALTYTVASSPSNGILTGTAPNLTYTPAPNFNGLDIFTFTVNDGTVNSNVGIVSISVSPVNDPPTASSQSVTLDQNTSAPITLIGNDVDGNALTYMVFTSPSHGTLSGTAPNLTYVPTPLYFGPDNFTFRVNDGTVNSGIATVSITVNFVNSPPVADDQTVTLPENAVTPITLTGSDPDGNALAYTVLTQPSHGTLAGSAPNLVYTPDPYYFGPDIITFKNNDGFVDSNIGTVAILVTYVNHSPTLNGLPILYVKEDSVRLICPSFADADGDLLALGLAARTLGDGTLVQAAAPFNFCYTFTPSLNNNGRSIWNLPVCDPGGLCASISVEIVVTPVNDPPQAVDDEIDMLAREIGHFNVTANDLTIESPYQEFYDIFVNDPGYGDSLRLVTTPIAGPNYGTAQLFANGQIDYTPQFDYVGDDSIRYQICDLGDLCSEATVIIHVGYPAFKIYEGVSPNGDGKNDYWRIDGIELYPNNSVKIFDRFNNLVYTTTAYSNESNNWQGQSNHGEFRSTLAEDTYYYSVDLGDGQKPISGFVMLKRQ